MSKKLTAALITLAYAAAIGGIVARIVWAIILAWRDTNGNGQIDEGE